MLDESNKFGSFIKLAREDAGLSGLELAKMVGVSRAHLWRIERGHSGYDGLAHISEALIKRLASVLKLDVDELLALDGKICSEVRKKIIEKPARANLIRGMK